MKDKVFGLLKTNLKNPKLYVGLFIILIVGVLLFPYIDANWLYYGRVEKRIEILDQISKLNKETISDNPILIDEYNSILQEISKQKDGSIGSIFITESSKEVKRNKFIWGGFLCWILSVICLFIKMEKSWYKILGFILFGLLGAGVGYVAMILPTIISPLCNYIIMPFLQCILLGMFITSSNKK